MQNDMNQYGLRQGVTERYKHILTDTPDNVRYTF